MQRTEPPTPTLNPFTSKSFIADWGWDTLPNGTVVTWGENLEMDSERPIPKIVKKLLNEFPPLSEFRRVPDQTD